MFQGLTDRLQAVFRSLAKKARLTESDVNDALRDIRLALLEADVNFKVVKDFIGRVRERAVGAEVLESLSPAQQVVKIVHEELVRTLGGDVEPLRFGPVLATIMLVGLQGSGKTTTAAKLAAWAKRRGFRPMLVAADVRRPAAIEQLNVLGDQIEVPVFSLPEETNAVSISMRAVETARLRGFSPVIIDTAGRLHIDAPMMEELESIKQAVKPEEVLLVVDAMTGQEAVNVAKEFHERVGVTGLIMTKLDGDARGGAALSIRSVAGIPVKLVGVGERIEALEPFHPDRMASRILGMGDVLSLIERAQQVVDQAKAEELERKVRAATFDLEDFLNQLRQVRKMGPLEELLEMVPGLGSLLRNQRVQIDERQFKRVEAIILSMTPEERKNPEIIGGSRRRRIARGSGTTPQQVNALLNQFFQFRRMMKTVARGRQGKEWARFTIPGL